MTVSMKFCQFSVEPLPEGINWRITGTLNEMCCGKPATCSIEEGGWTYLLCAEHYDQITSFERERAFSGEGFERVLVPND